MEAVSKLRVLYNCINCVRSLPVQLLIPIMDPGTTQEAGGVRMRSPEEIAAGEVDAR